MTGFQRSNGKAAKLTPSQVREIRELYLNGATQRELCQRFCVSVGQIGRIVRGESWTQFASADRPTDQEAIAARAKALEESPRMRVEAQASFERLMRSFEPPADAPPTTDSDNLSGMARLQREIQERLAKAREIDDGLDQLIKGD